MQIQVDSKQLINKLTPVTMLDTLQPSIKLKDKVCKEECKCQCK